MITFPKLFFFIVIALFGIIGAVAYFKNDNPQIATAPAAQKPIEVQLGKETRVAIAPPKPAAVPKPAISTAIAQVPSAKPPTPTATPQIAKPVNNVKTEPTAPNNQPIAKHESPLPEADRIDQLFNKDGPLLPIVETITYKSRVSWQKGRPAWLSDYAGHYHTSRHFIARSLNGRPDYLKQDLAEGARFNVLRLDKNIQFHLVIDISRCKMWFYYDDLNDHERVLLKTYAVGLGRVDGSKVSGCLTPVGKYTLGNKTAIYKPNTMGTYHGENIEMITVFGTRWIPFDKEIENCSAPPKGFGLHGVPWSQNASKVLAQDNSSLGKHQSDGCVRMASEDIEELFAIIITKPTTIELVKDFYDARLPASITTVK